MEQPLFRLLKPKKRKWVRLKKVSPFPVPISSVSGLPPLATKWCYFTGFLTDNYVAVVHTGDIDFLYTMGFFGKGHLSQNQPQSVRPKDRQSSATDLKIMSRRRYLRHVAWDSGTNEDLLDITPAVVRQKEPVVSVTTNSAPCASKQEIPICSEIQPDRHLEVGNNPIDDTVICPLQIGGDPTILSADNLITDTTDKVDPWASTTAQESIDFWTSGSEQDRCSSQLESETASKLSEDYGSRDRIETESTMPELLSSADSGLGLSKETDIIVDSIIVEEGKCANTSDSKKTKRSSDSESLLKIKSIESETGNFSKSETVVALDGTSSSVSSHKDISARSYEVGKDQIPSHLDAIEVPRSLTSAEVEGLDISTKTCVDERCLSDHEDGDLFVVNDTDESEAEESGVTRLKWEPTVKRDPYLLKEELRLSLEEAFFLSYGLGCLVTLDEQKKPLDLTEMWREFGHRQPGFLAKYIVYHNFRSKGWVPKQGLKFGVDLLVYSVGPPFTHATYAVLVIEVDSADHIPEKTLNWSLLAGQHRVIKQAGKELMLCYVIKPSDLTDTELDSPRCIPRFTVQEVVVRRWMSKHDRDNLNFVEIP